MSTFPLIVVFLSPTDAVALCSSKSVVSYSRGQMDISYKDATALFDPPIGHLSILSTESGMWKAVMHSTLKAITFQEYNVYGLKCSREGMVERCSIIFSKWYL